MKRIRIWLGIGVAFFFGYQAMPHLGVKIAQVFIAAAVGLIFFLGGVAMLHFLGKPRVFDKALGLYWKGAKAPDRMSV